MVQQVRVKLTSGLTEDNPVVCPVHPDHPGLGGLGSVVNELLETLPIHQEGVLVGQTGGLDADGGFGVGGSDSEGLCPNQLKHPVPPEDFLWTGDPQDNHPAVVTPDLVLLKEPSVLTETSETPECLKTGEMF